MEVVKARVVAVVEWVMVAVAKERVEAVGVAHQVAAVAAAARRQQADHRSSKPRSIQGLLKQWR